MALTMSNTNFPGISTSTNANMNTNMPFVSYASSADMSNLFTAFNQGQAPEVTGNAANTSLALPTPEGFTTWEQVLGSFNGMELSQENTVTANSANSMLEDLDDEELIELPRVSPINLAGTDVTASASSPGVFGDIFAVKPDPEKSDSQSIVPVGGMFGNPTSLSIPASSALGSRRGTSALLSPTAADMVTRSGTSSPSSMLDFAASLDAIPRRLDKDVGPSALVPYTGGQVPAPAAEDATSIPHSRALTASASQWQNASTLALEQFNPSQQENTHTPDGTYPDRIEDLTETQLATIDRKALVSMMAAAKYTEKQKAEVKKKRRLFKNRISAKGAIIRKKKEQRSLTMVNTHLIRTVEELQKQNEALHNTNQQLEHNFSAAQRLAREREQEKLQYEQKIAQLTAMLKQLDPSAETA